MSQTKPSNICLDHFSRENNTLWAYVYICIKRTSRAFWRHELNDKKRANFKIQVLIPKFPFGPNNRLESLI